MELLINKSDVEKYFQVAIGRSTDEFEKFIREAQMFDLKAIIPEKFYYDLLINQHEEILNGKSYEYDGAVYKFEGVKSVLAHFTYGLYLLKSNTTDTSFGFVQKKTNNSDPVEYKERKDWYYKHREQANLLWEDVKKYLNRFPDQYPIWKECSFPSSKSFKTRIIQ